jgi:hypothetical protein
MFAQVIENFRKASESSYQAGQDLLKQWVQQAGAAPGNPAVPGVPAWAEGLQKRWFELTTDALSKHRELLDATYRSSIQLLGQTLEVGEAKSLEEQRRRVEDLWRKLSDSVRVQYEAQYREFQESTNKWLEVVRSGVVPPRPAGGDAGAAK